MPYGMSFKILTLIHRGTHLIHPAWALYSCGGGGPRVGRCGNPVCKSPDELYAGGFAAFHSLYMRALNVGWTGFKLSRFLAGRGGLFCNSAVSHSSPDALHDVGVS